jgi:redox-sensitive bicupin YhaK (pirin superfamily)
MKPKLLLLPLLGLIIGLTTTAFLAHRSQTDEWREVKALHQPVRSDIKDLITYRAMPTSTLPMERLDPFIFLNHHGPQTYEPNNNGLPFGPHPHRGFETVTFILEGDLVHADNNGHKSKINAGGIQWMTAGEGVIHSELSSEEFKKNGGDVEMLQLWINLPAKHKNADPAYTGLQEDGIPELKLDAGKVTVNLISGEWGGTKGPIQSITNVMMSYLEMQPGGKATTAVPEDREIFMYVVSGAVEINGTEAGTRTLVEFAPEGQKLELHCNEEAVVLFGHANPNNEPIVSQGPFVMNTKEEIKQAYKDYRNGKFGRDLK